LIEGCGDYQAFWDELSLSLSHWLIEGCGDYQAFWDL